MGTLLNADFEMLAGVDLCAADLGILNGTATNE